MADDSIQFEAEFPDVTRDEWQAEATRSLRGGSFQKRLVSETGDGIEILPLYTADDVDGERVSQFPAAPPFTRGARAVPADEAWEVRQEFRKPYVREVNTEILLDLERGVSGIRIVPDDNFAHTRTGIVNDGVALRTLDDINLLLGGVHLDMVGTAIRGRSNGLGALALLVAHTKTIGTDLALLRGTVGFDPLGQLVTDGELPTRWESWMKIAAAMTRWTGEHSPNLRPIEVSSVVFHEAGATEAREIAFALASGTEYLRGLLENDVRIDEAASAICFLVASGRDTFIEIAKFRALRQVWARVVGACGGSADAQRASVHARTSWMTSSQRDPWVNMLRATSQTFAAAVGGAESITVAGFDETHGHADVFSRRISRNTQLILRDESHIGRVVDPAGGSYYVEHLTQALADKAWSIFQNIEADGGLVSYVKAGKAYADIESTNQARDLAIATRKMPITGVSEFPNLDEEPVERECTASVEPSLGNGDAPATAKAIIENLNERELVEAAIEDVESGTSTDEIFAALAALPGSEKAPVVEAHRYSALWEALRDACDHAAERGKRPQCFLANIGEIPEHRARAQFAQNLFQAAGIRAENNDGFASIEATVEAYEASNADVACICSTDAKYQEVVADLASALKDAGAVEVYVAGRPGEHEHAWNKAGVDAYVYMGSNVLDTLIDTLDKLDAFPDEDT